MGSGSTTNSNALVVITPQVGDAAPVGTPDYLPWPVAGFMPSPLLPEQQWSVSSSRGADLSQATVQVTKDGKTLPVTTNHLEWGYGPDTVGFTFDHGYPGYTDQRYQVTVTGIRNWSGVAQPPYTYTTTVFDPDSAYTPPNPTVTLRASDGFLPGLPLPLTATVNVPSGQGWHIDYSIIQAIGTETDFVIPPSPATCSLTRRTALSTDPNALSTSLLCDVPTTNVSVKAVITSEDGLTSTHILKLTPEYTTLHYAGMALTASANPVRVGTPVTLSAKMTDLETGQPVFGHIVHFRARTDNGDEKVADAVTDATGTARTTVTPRASTRYIVSTDSTHTWPAAEAVLDVTANTATALTLPVVPSYVDAGTEVTLTGRLTADPDQPLGGQNVQLWRHVNSQWTRTHTLLTDSNGQVTAKVTVTADASYQLRFDATSTYTAAQSPQVTIRVRRATTTTAALDQSVISAGGKVTVSGTLATASGPVTGAPVELWRRNADIWTKVVSATTDTAGKVSFPTSPNSSGSYQLRFTATDRLLASTTAELPFTVRTPLTLTATMPASAPYGSQLNITATLRSPSGPLAGRALQLWQVSSGGDTLISTSAQTGAEGTATLLVTANANRTYQVRVPADARYEAAASASMGTVAVRTTALTGVVADRSLSFGDKVEVAATLTSTSAGATGPLAGLPVELWATPTGGVRTLAATVTTSAAGTAAFSVPTTSTSTFQLVFPGTADAARSTGDLGEVTVLRTTTSSVTVPTSTGYDTPTTITGSLVWSGSTIGVAGAAVELWSAPSSGSIATKVAAAVTDATGKASFSVRPTSSALYFMRHPQPGISYPSWPPSSGTQLLPVVRDTAATVAAPGSASYGTPVSLTGTLRWAGSTSAVAGQPVELWAAKAGQPAVKVSSATTSSTGQATFTVTALATSTYQLRYTGRPVGSLTASSTTSPSITVTALRPTTATTKVSTSRLTYGARVTVSGTLSWSGTSTGIAGQPVELWGYAAGRWTRVTTATTTSTGTVTLVAKPTFSTSYQLRYLSRAVGSVTAKASTSVSVKTTVVAKVYLITPTKVSSSSYVTLTGSISPVASGRTISIVVKGVTVTKVTTGSTGKFSARVKYPRGSSSVYASLATSSLLAGARSTTYTVSAS